MATNDPLIELAGGVPSGSLGNTLSGLDVSSIREALQKDFVEESEELINNAPPPAQQPVPSTPTPLAAFGAQLAANLGSSLLQNPQASRQTFLKIQDVIQRARDVEDNNFLRSVEGDTQRVKSLRAFRLRALEQGFEADMAAVAEGDPKAIDRAAAKAKAIETARQEARTTGAKERLEEVTLPKLREQAKLGTEKGVTLEGERRITKKTVPGKAPLSDPVPDTLTPNQFFTRVDQIDDAMTKIRSAKSGGFGVSPEQQVITQRARAKDLKTFRIRKIQLAMSSQDGDTAEIVFERVLNTVPELKNKESSDPEIQTIMRKIVARFSGE